MHIQAKRVQQPQPGKRRHTNFVFQTTSLFFELLKIRYDPRNSLNWSDQLKPFEIHFLGYHHPNLGIL